MKLKIPSKVLLAQMFYYSIFSSFYLLYKSKRKWKHWPRFGNDKKVKKLEELIRYWDIYEIFPFEKISESFNVEVLNRNTLFPFYLIILLFPSKVPF